MNVLLVILNMWLLIRSIRIYIYEIIFNVGKNDKIDLSILIYWSLNQTLDQDFDATSTRNRPNSDELEEYHATVHLYLSHIRDFFLSLLVGSTFGWIYPMWRDMIKTCSFSLSLSQQTHTKKTFIRCHTIYILTDLFLSFFSDYFISKYNTPFYMSHNLFLTTLANSLLNVRV